MRWLASLGFLFLAAVGCARRDADQSGPAAVTATNGTVGARGGAFDERSEERGSLATHLAEQGVRDPSVLQAMRAVPRHAFVAASWSHEAYADRPLPIGHGQSWLQAVDW